MLRERLGTKSFRLRFAQLVKDKTGEEVVPTPLLTEERSVREDGGPSSFSWRLWRAREIVLLVLACVAILLCCVAAAVYVWHLNHKKPSAGAVFGRGPHMPKETEEARARQLPRAQSHMFNPPETRV